MTKIVLSKKAERQLKELQGTSYFSNIIDFIEKLYETPFPKGFDIKKVKRDQSIRVRFGRYRLIYVLNKKEEIIEISSIILRKKAFK